MKWYFGILRHRGAFALLALGVVVLGGGTAAAVLWPTERRHVLNDVQSSLNTMADDRAYAVRELVQDAASVARTVAAYPTVAYLAEERRGGPHPFPRDEGAASHLNILLSTVARESGYRFAGLFDTRGVMLAHSDSAWLLGESVAALRAVIALDTTVLALPSLPDGSTSTLLIAVPVHAERRTSPGPVGAVLVALDLKREFFNVLHPGRNEGHVVEAALVAADRDSIFVFSPSLLLDGQTVDIHIPNLEGRAVTAAASGRNTFGEFLDYRGTPVFAATRKLPGFTWGIVVKTDRAHVTGEIRNRVLTILFALSGIVIALLGVAYGVWRSAEAAYRDSLARSQAQSAERLRLQIEYMPIACVVANPRLDAIVEWNQAAERIFGYTKEEVIGRSPFGLMVPERARAAIESDIATSNRAGEIQARFEQNMTKDGRTIFCRWTNVPLRDENGRLVAVMGMAQDVTAQRENEEQLRLLLRAVDQSPASIVMTDTRARILYVNPKFEAVTGYTAAEAIGQNPRMLQSGSHPADFYRQMWETITSGQIWRGELHNRTKDGRLFRERASIAPVTDASGTITHYLAIKEDITDRKQLEDELRQAQKMEAVGRLAGGVAHDFNNLLTVILGNCEIVLADMKDDDEIRRDLVEIEAAARRAASLTRQLLAFSRRQIIQPQILDLNALVEGIGKMIRRLLGEDITVAMQLAKDVGRVIADPGQLEQVLLNLSVNARDAMPDGGRLAIQTANMDVDPTFQRDHPGAQVGPHVKIAITDTGTGMTPEVRAHLFEPFFTTKPAGKGTGLGLSTVYGIVKQSNGSIFVQSEPDRGSTFTILLPRSDAEPTSRAPVASEISGGTETILIAEDDGIVRSIARRALEGRGYRILEARDGEGALKLASQESGAIHLLLTDLVMPGMGGQELARRLTAQFPGVRTLFTSGYSETAATNGGVLSPDVAFLAKPFSVEEIARKVRAVLDQVTP
ncbi:MAG: PAS domain S-box protein [Gemmatimonadetes bacterium]|nr:PAS domain S-box protein [Gemmatimonadota bacterium]